MEAAWEACGGSLQEGGESCRTSHVPFPRGLWFALLTVPMALLAEGSALADSPASPDGVELPHGIHLGNNGRYYQDVCDHDYRFHCLSKRLLPETFRPLTGHPPNSGNYCTCGSMSPCGGGGTTPPSGSMTPANVLAAYKIPPASSANGKIVAIIDMPDATTLADVNVYRKAFKIPELAACPNNGLPDPTSGTPCFAAVDETGAVTTSAGDCPASDGETGLDVDMVSASCPDCSIVLVQMTNASLVNGPTDMDFLDAVKSAIKVGASAISLSFGGGEFSDPTGKDFTTPGHLVIAAAGDAGYLNEIFGGTTPSWPASASDVLSVGGTTLELKGSTYTEVVWDDGTQGGAGGSGCSSEIAMPTYQTQFLATHANVFGSCTKRASVDLAAAAEFNPTETGGAIAEYDSVNQWVPVVGTSAASPMVAGLLTRLGLTDVISNDFGWVYDNIASFNDVTFGNNDPGGTCTSVLCKAGTGWDGPTGVGTPNAENLAALVAAEEAEAGADGGDEGGAGEGGANKDAPLSGSKGGCGCATATPPGLDLSALGLGGALLALVTRRRRG
jgi:hypothetical protein